jgi:hypothetical protein
MGNALSAHVWTYSKRIFGTPEVGREVRFRTKDGLLDEQLPATIAEHNHRAVASALSGWQRKSSPILASSGAEDHLLNGYVHQHSMGESPPARLLPPGGPPGALILGDTLVACRRRITPAEDRMYNRWRPGG